MESLQELEAKNPIQPEGICHPGGKWCLQCGRVYPWPGHTSDCVLNGYVPKGMIITGKGETPEEED